MYQPDDEEQAEMMRRAKHIALELNQVGIERTPEQVIEMCETVITKMLMDIDEPEKGEGTAGTST